MKLYCSEEFKRVVGKLSKNKSYRSLQQSIIKDFCRDNLTIEELKKGALLNGSATEPYIKKRVNGSGGYRVYYLLIVKNECVYLMFVHPKTGSEGSENITKEAQDRFYEEIIESIQADDLYLVKQDDNDSAKLKFVPKVEADLEEVAN